MSRATGITCIDHYKQINNKTNAEECVGHSLKHCNRPWKTGQSLQLAWFFCCNKERRYSVAQTFGQQRVSYAKLEREKHTYSCGKRS